MKVSIKMNQDKIYVEGMIELSEITGEEEERDETDE